MISRRWLLFIAAGLLLILTGALVHAERLAFAQTPEQAVARYAERVLRSDETSALAAWSASIQRPQQEWIGAFARRREVVTKELIAGPPTRFRVASIEWWRTCCEPGIAERPEYAGVARLLVVFDSAAGPSREYFFDVRRDPSCCMFGDPIEDLQFRYWILLDVYPTTKQPLQFPWVYDQSLGSHPVIGLPEP